MITRLNAVQIAKFWDVIKYSFQQTERLGVDFSEASFNVMFAKLMADKAQCFIKHLDGQIHAVMITEVFENRFTGVRSFNLRSLYAFKPFDLEEWEDNFKIILKVAQSEKCNRIIFDSNHHKLLKMGSMVGFRTLHTTMEYKLGG